MRNFYVWNLAARLVAYTWQSPGYPLSALHARALWSNNAPINTGHDLPDINASGQRHYFLIAQQAVSYGIAIATITLLLIGYGVAYLPILKNKSVYIETICLTLTVFLLMVPTVSETLRRVPDGNPIVTDLKSPILLGAQAGLLVALIVGLTLQIIYLRRSKASLAA